MPTYRIQTALQDVSGLPRDQYVNSIHVTLPTVMTEADWAVFTGEVPAFYESIKAYLSAGIDIYPHTVKAYTVGAPLQTPPLFSHIWAFTTQPGVGQAPLPNEVACCLTYHAAPQPGVMRQSWRGRFYVGPLNSSAAGAAGSGGGRPTTPFRDELCLKASNFFNNINQSIAPFKVVVYSKKLGMVYPVVRVSVDDAWDTQRSRGLRASAIKKIDLQAPAGGPPGPA